MSAIEYTVRSLGDAAEAGDLNKVKVIAEKVDVNEKDKDFYGRTALHRAALGGHREVCQWLLEKGCDIHAKDNSGWTALHYAAWRGRREVCQLLLEKGSDIHAKDNSGWTALHWAANGGYREVCQLLLEQGSDIHAKINDGDTPLMRACMNGETETAEFLIQKGSHLETKNNQGLTAVDIALEKNYTNIAVQLNPDKQKLCLTSLERGYNGSVKTLYPEVRNVRDSKNNSALLIASMHGYPRIVKYLLTQGAYVSEVNADGDTALHLAAESGNITVIKHLLNHGASLHCQNNNGFTPEVSAQLKGTQKSKQVSRYLAKVRKNEEKESEEKDDRYYDVQTPMTMPPMTPGTFELVLEDEDVADLVESDITDIDDDLSQPSTSGQFSPPDFGVPIGHTPLPTSTITRGSFAVPTNPAPGSAQANLPLQAEGNSDFISQPDFAVHRHSPLPTSTMRISSVSADNFAVPTHPAPRSGQASLPIQAQGSSGYFFRPDYAVPGYTPSPSSTITMSSEITEDNFAVPTHPAPRSGLVILPTQAQGNSDYVPPPDFAVPGGLSPSRHTSFPTSTITRSSVSADNFAVPFNLAPRSEQASLLAQAQGDSNDNAASELEQLKLQLAAERREKEAERREKEAERREKEAERREKEAERREKEAERRKNEAIIADKKRKMLEKDQTIADKKQKLADKKQKLSEKEQTIADKKQEIAEKDKIIKEKDQKFKTIGKKMFEFSKEIIFDEVPCDEKNQEETSASHSEYNRAAIPGVSQTSPSQVTPVNLDVVAGPSNMQAPIVKQVPGKTDQQQADKVQDRHDSGVKLDTEFPTDAQLHCIAEKIGNEKLRMASELEIGQAKVQQIEQDHPRNSHDQNFQILLKWREASHLDAENRCKKLMECMEVCGREPLVQMVKGYYEEYKGEVPSAASTSGK